MEAEQLANIWRATIALSQGKGCGTGTSPRSPAQTPPTNLVNHRWRISPAQKPAALLQTAHATILLLSMPRRPQKLGHLQQDRRW